MTVGISNPGQLLEAFRTWLLANPNWNIQDFAEEHDTNLPELADGWNAHFAQADFSRNYDLDTSTSQSGAQGAAQAATQAAPTYTPSSPPPHGSSPAEYEQYLTQEVHDYQEFSTINNIEDNSFNQQIVGSDVDIDNSDNTVGDEGILVRDSELDGSNLNTGDVGRRGWRRRRRERWQRGRR